MKVSGTAFKGRIINLKSLHWKKEKWWDASNSILI